MKTILSRVLRDSMTSYVGQSVGLLVDLSFFSAFFGRFFALLLLLLVDFVFWSLGLLVF